MTYRKYTQCFKYSPLLGPGVPFNKKELSDLPIEYGGVVVSFMSGGALIGLVIGVVPGAVVGGLVGLFVGIVSAVAMALDKVADRWLHERLVCLGEAPLCAVGTVTEGPKRSDLGEFDNDQFFDVRLMPHRAEDAYVTLVDPTKPNPQPPLFGAVAPTESKNMRDHPKNEIYADDFQGQTLLRPKPQFLPPTSDLGYNNQDKSPEEMHTASMLHCEAEGDFWVRVRSLSLVIGVLVAMSVGVAAAGAAAGGYSGSALGCALGAWFFGPIGCTIGAWIGGLLGAAAGAAVAGGSAALGLKALLQSIFDEDPGDVEDANVGDRKLGKIMEGSRVAVYGEHVYDGFHDGWHEFHPLMAVMKIEPDILGSGQTTKMLEWDPNFPDSKPTPRALPDTDVPALTPDDMRQGMNSDAFEKCAKAFKSQWCTEITAAFAGPTRATQQGLEHRWTIHPDVDGCAQDRFHLG